MSGALASYLPSVLAAYGILAVGVASPGPAVALILGTSLSQGRRAALLTATGVALGSSVLAVATLTGLSVVATRIGWAMDAVRALGVAYLLWLTWSALRKAAHPPRVTPTTAAPRPAWRLVLGGAMMQIGNPKALVFWIAIAAIGQIGAAPPPVLVLFLAGAFALSFAGHAGWALLLSTAPIRAAYGRARRWIEGALGGIFAYTAWRIATAPR